jgi:hypothetical protein
VPGGLVAQFEHRWKTYIILILPSMRKSKVYFWVSCASLSVLVTFSIVGYFLSLASASNNRALGFVLRLMMTTLGVPSIIAPISGVILFVYGFGLFFAGTRDRFLVTGIIFDGVIVTAFVLAFVVGGKAMVPGMNRDAVRIADLRQVQNSLELYYNKCGYYPGEAHTISPCGQFVQITSWKDLTNALAHSNLGIARVPNDPRYVANRQWTPYFYGTNASGTGYVVGAKLELENPGYKSLLAESPRGVIYGVNCNPPVYCIQR